MCGKRSVACLLAALAMTPPGAMAQSGGVKIDKPTPPTTVTPRTIDLRPRFRLGQEIRFTMQLVDREIPDPKQPPAKDPKTGKPMDTSFRQDVGVRLKVESTDAEGNTTLDLVLESFKMKGNGPMGEVDFDSTRPAKEGDPLDALFRTITTTNMKVAVDRDGEVKGITPGSTGGGAGGLLNGKITGGDFMRSLVGPVFSPRKGATSASLGERWTEESTMKGTAGEWTLVTTKTLKSVSGGRATIDVIGAVKVDPTSLGGGNGAQAKSETVHKGQVIWDTESGMLERMEMRMASSVGLIAGLGDLASLGGPAGGIGEEGAQAKPAKHETTVTFQRTRR